MMRELLVPLMLFASGAFMATAWLGHLKFYGAGFMSALLVSWAIVLPEYILNVTATRWGFGVYSGVQMAAFHLCSGVVCIALVSHYLLGEPWAFKHLLGLGLVAAGLLLVLQHS